MDIWSNIALGFSTALSLDNIMFCFFGVFLGTLFGILPGIGSLAAVSMLLPLSFHLDPATAIVMLAGIYYGAEYGGSTTSILLNLPGTPSNAVTCLDGYPMAQQGRAGVALFTTTIASFLGGSVGIIALFALSPLIVSWALAFGPAEYFTTLLLGLVAASAVTHGKPVKGLAMVFIGVLLGGVGADLQTGVLRFTLGLPELWEGISIVALAMGLFGVSEIIVSLTGGERESFTQSVSFRSMLPSKKEAGRCGLPILRGSSLGVFFGALPGTGPTIATFIAYALEKRVSRNPDRFGKGTIEGVASPESANNAAVQSAFIPTLTLGVPGSATMAILMSALLINGITPGPQLMADNPDIFWGLAASFWIGNIMLLVLNIPLIGIWVRLLRVPYSVLFPAVLCLICIGVYTLRSSTFDVFLLLFFGIIGFALRTLGFQLAPILVGFILGPMVEENFKRAMMLSGGSFSEIISQPVTGTMIFLTFVIFVWGVFDAFRGKRQYSSALGAAID